MTSVRGTRNERLAEAIARRGLDRATVAAKAGVDPRTLDRWVADRRRLPYANSREALSQLLDVPAGVLWPDAPQTPQGTAELVALYPTRHALSTSHVMAVLEQAEHNIDVLVLSGSWLWDSVPGFGERLSEKANSGLAVRVCLGDPSGESARQRGEEEGIGELMGARCALSLTYARKKLSAHPAAIRLHDTTLYASILRFDDEVFVNWHLLGAPAAESPVFHVRVNGQPGVARSAIESFERVWSGARPLDP